MSRAIIALNQILKSHPGAQVRLRKSGDGVSEITVDRRLSWSKKASGRFPPEREVTASVG